MSACEQETCPNWDGWGCPCGVLDIEKPSHAGCVLCGCGMDEHNDPRGGGGCATCGDCEGWL